MNWQQRIDRAKKRGKFFKTDLDLITDFQTCMVGEIFGDNWHLAASASEIHRLGVDAISAIIYDDVDNAQKIYDRLQEIEATRGAEFES